MDKVVHIDGDILVYAGGFAAERGEYKVSWLDLDEPKVAYFAHKKEMQESLTDILEERGVRYMVEFERHPEPVEYALSNVKNIIDSIRSELNCDSYFVYLSGPTNFRDGLATIRPYKGNRDKSHKPVHGPAIRDYVCRRHPHVVSDGDEADDVIGYTHYARWLKDSDSSVIATQDKDLNMIPGWHYNFATRTKEYISPEAADYNFYHQLLTGDPTDNIPGVPRCGKVKASKLLDGVVGKVNMYEVCRKAYAKAYEDGDAALLENARLLWIRRKEKEIWQPPSMLSLDELLTTSTANESTKST